MSRARAAVERAVALEDRVGLLEGGFHPVELVTRDDALAARAYRSACRSSVRCAWSATSASTVLRAASSPCFGRGERGAAHAQRRLVDRDLLLVVRGVESRQQRARLDPLPLVERQLHDPRLHRLECDHAFVRLDVARQQQDAVGGGPYGEKREYEIHPGPVATKPTAIARTRRERFITGHPSWQEPCQVGKKRRFRMVASLSIPGAGIEALSARRSGNGWPRGYQHRNALPRHRRCPARAHSVRLASRRDPAPP